jgi:hypothetical protein
MSLSAVAQTQPPTLFPSYKESSVDVPSPSSVNPVRRIPPNGLEKPPSGIHWGALMSQWWLEISLENGSRLLRQPKTRAALRGKFFDDWFSTVTQYPFDRWDDGDSFQTSYIYHPAQGALAESIFWQNNDHVRFSDQDFHSSTYRKALLEAFLFATLDAVQWKLGPMGESSIGNVGLPAHWWDSQCQKLHVPCITGAGLNDFVTNEAGGTVMFIGFQWLDKHVQKPLESRVHNRALIDALRILTNPPQSAANIFRFRRPCFRDNR